MMKYSLQQMLIKIGLPIFCTLAPVYGHAVNELVDDPAVLLGSHADVNAQFANARHLWKSGKLKESAALYESLIERYPDLPDPYNNLAVIYAAQGDYKKAQEILEKGLNTHPGYAAIYENLTAIYVEMARDSYGKALQFNGNSQRQLKLRALAELTVKPVPVVKSEPPVKVAVVEVPTPGVVDSEPAESEPPTRTETPKVAVADKASEPAPEPEEAVGVTSAVAAMPDTRQVTETLESWAAAWSAQSVKQYLGYYDESFQPDGLSRRKWEAQRRNRIRRPQWIRVSLSNYEVKPIDNQRVRVELKQRYQSNTYSDQERKEFILMQREQGWRIVSERSL